MAKIMIEVKKGQVMGGLQLENDTIPDICMLAVELEILREQLLIMIKNDKNRKQMRKRN